MTKIEGDVLPINMLSLTGLILEIPKREDRRGKGMEHLE